jgi:hypothetical protein
VPKPRDRQPLTDNQRTFVVVFVLILGVIVFLVYQSIQSGIDRML